MQTTNNDFVKPLTAADPRELPTENAAVQPWPQPHVSWPRCCSVSRLQGHSLDARQRAETEGRGANEHTDTASHSRLGSGTGNQRRAKRRQKRQKTGTTGHASATWWGLRPVPRILPSPDAIVPAILPHPTRYLAPNRTICLSRRGRAPSGPQTPTNTPSAPQASPATRTSARPEQAEDNESSPSSGPAVDAARGTSEMDSVSGKRKTPRPGVRTCCVLPIPKRARPRQ